MMRELPILFNDEMVRAILDGRKTQTRRPVKWTADQEGYAKHRGWNPIRDGVCVVGWECDGPACPHCGEITSHHEVKWTKDVRSPFGAAGDYLWVRECWNCFTMEDSGDGENWEPGFPVASGLKSRPQHTVMMYRASHHPCGMPWRPSIHMPRWASRISLRVKRVWVERVQEISEADACSEGCEPNSPHEATGATHRGAFAGMWDECYGQYTDFSWSANPWVWCCEFERVE